MGKISQKILMEASYLTSRYLLPPEFLSVTLTYRCNFHCQSCEAWKLNNNNELTEKEWLLAITDLNKILPKNTFVEISGGEPLIKKNILLPIIKKLKKHFFRVALNSNGSLINESVIKELEKVHLDCLKVSLYSLDAGIHNQLRGTKIAYGNAIQAIRLINKSKIKLEIGILITSKNITGVPQLINYLRKFEGISIILQPLDEIFYSAEGKNIQQVILPKNLWPKKKAVIDFFDWLEKDNSTIKNSSSHLQAIKNYYLNPKSTLRYRCFSGQRNLIIYPDGGVSLCYKHQNVGNIKKDFIGNILKDQAIQGRRDIKNCQKFCRVLGCIYSRSFSEYFREKILSKQIRIIKS